MFEAPALQTPPKFHERTPQERRKKENCGGRGKKSEILGGPAEERSGRGAVRGRGRGAVRGRGSSGEGGGLGGWGFGSGRTNNPEALRGMPGCLERELVPPEVRNRRIWGTTTKICAKGRTSGGTTAKVCTTACTRVWSKSIYPNSNWPNSN